MALIAEGGCCLEVNAALVHWLGRQPQELQGACLGELLHPDDGPPLADQLAALVTAPLERLRWDTRCHHADGSWLWGRLTLSCLPAGEGRLVLAELVDIQAEVEVRSALERARGADPLTGLANKSTFLNGAAEVLGRLDRGQRPAAVLSIGIDRLSLLNHALTHRAGDLLICRLAERLTQALASAQLLARGTGDTFLVLLDPVQSAAQAAAIAERLRLACKGSVSFEGHRIEPSVSIGVAVCSGPASADELVRQAALAMDAARDGGRDRWALLDPQLAERAQEELLLLQELRSALEHEELQAWFMPLVDLRSGSLRGYEALVRWLRRDGSVDLPDRFLPLARRCGLEDRLDRLILRQSIQALAALPAPLSISANLSAASLGSADLAADVARWLAQADVAPQRLHLEITETALLLLDPQVRVTIQSLAELGVRWVVDDFGTGFSSISHLRDLPLHGLKLDRSFTEAIRLGDQKSVRLAQALAGLAEGLELDTVAEGIEHPEDVTILCALGWHCGQGWHFGQAAPLSHWRGDQGPITLASPVTPTAEPALVASVSRQTWALAVTDNVPVGLFALRIDPAGHRRFQFVSGRCLELLQLRRQQVDELATVLSRVHPEDRKRLVTLWGQSNLDTPLSWEGRLQLWARTTWVSIEATPIPQADGSRLWQGVLADITDRKLQELHLRRVLDEAPIPIAIQELKGDDPRITYLNQQFRLCFGYDLSTIPRLSEWARLAYPDPRQRQAVFAAWDAGVAQARAGDGVVPSLEAEITAADGSRRMGLFTAVLLGDAEMVISVLDITSWRRAEAELEEARHANAQAALAITEAIPVGTYTMVQPPEGGLARFSFMSERFLQLCGLSREEAAADPQQVFARVHPDDQQAWLELNREAFAQRRPFYGECRALVDGELRWISAESVPRSLPDGSTVWEGVLTDISKQRRALEQLEQERTLLETVLTHIDAHIFMKDRQGRYLYANPAAMELLSGSGAAVLGHSDEDLLPPSVAAAFRAADAQVWASDGPLEIEERISQPDGSERIFLSKKLPYRQPGQPDALIGFSTEITGLRLAHEQLAASEEHYRLLAENSSDVVFRLDDQGRILWVSPSLTTVLGWRPEDWVGQVGTQFLVHRGTTEQYQANRNLLRSTAAATAVSREQILAKDGSVHWIETHAGPYRNARGELDGVVASFRTIDAELAAEQELFLNEERYRLLAEYARDVIWTMEPDGRISYVSPSIQLMRGFSPQEAMAQPLEQIHPPESLQRSGQYFANLLADLEAGRPVQPFRGELEYFCRDGSTIWTEVIALPVLDGEGRLEKLIGVSRDISERKYYEQQLEAMATTDSLTAIANRRHIEELVQAAMARADRYDEPLSLILFDIDHFKTVNDEQGHQAGDQVLVEFSQRIRQQLRSSDSFGRWGGEEFLILLPQTDLPAATALAEQLRQLVAASPFALACSLTASFGVAQHIRHEQEVAWFRRVDDCLYAAKRTGRNRVVHAPTPS
jgi:diguanylate cyclase (GGDEF)-like protein/PAS domain S-box-containing protein